MSLPFIKIVGESCMQKAFDSAVGTLASDQTVSATNGYRSKFMFDLKQQMANSFTLNALMAEVCRHQTKQNNGRRECTQSVYIQHTFI